MVSRMVFWAGFGVLTRLWQLGLQRTTILSPVGLKNWYVMYPLYAGVGASFGYWLDDIDASQQQLLAERKEAILAKRARRAAREAGEASS